MRPREQMPVCRRRGVDRGDPEHLREPALMKLVVSASSGRTVKAVGRLHSAPSNRVDVEQGRQPSPVSERSAVWLGATLSACRGYGGGNPVALEAIEMVVVWRHP